MIAVFLIGAGVGLLAGAGLGFIVAALMVNSRVEEARAVAVRANMSAAQHRRRAEGLLAELDALSIAGPDTAAGVRQALDAVPVEIWTDSGQPLRPSFDANPTILLGPGRFGMAIYPRPNSTFQKGHEA